MTKKRKVKNVGKRNIKKIEEQMSKFWIFARLRLVVKYIIILYICMGVIYLAGPYYMNIVLNHFDGIMYVVMGIVLLISFAITFWEYKKKEDITNGICFRVLEKCEVKEQYKRYTEIKKCIETYKNADGICDLNSNIGVIEAAIEHDQARSVIYPVFITIISVFFYETDMISINSILGLFLVTIIVLSMLELVRQIPRNAFIKKVIENIKEENLNN